MAAQRTAPTQMGLRAEGAGSRRPLVLGYLVPQVGWVAAEAVRGALQQAAAGAEAAGAASEQSSSSRSADSPDSSGLLAKSGSSGW